ncbi:MULTISPECIES: hypothetical protein [Brevundimonas]|uniref:hypothetical protein n=1 Tax=Brevundimonas TaxID=41275 RepID=UPI001572823E|nr:hypothetical protein [Brevundimonas vesicularis]NSX32320.1 hypothetical protein [Brevundimonas vesicularis]
MDKPTPYRVDIPLNGEVTQLTKHVIWLSQNIKNHWSQDASTSIDAAIDDLLAGRPSPPAFTTYWFEIEEDAALFKTFWC